MDKSVQILPSWGVWVHVCVLDTHRVVEIQLILNDTLFKMKQNV